MRIHRFLIPSPLPLWLAGCVADAPSPLAGERRLDGPLEIPVRYVPPGEVRLGSPASEGGRDPDEVTINGYDAIHMIAIGLKSIGGKTDDKKAMMEAIRKPTYDGPRGPMRIDPKTNNIGQNIYMVEVKDVGGKPTHVVLDTIKDVQDPPSGCNM